LSVQVGTLTLDEGIKRDRLTHAHPIQTDTVCVNQHDQQLRQEHHLITRPGLSKSKKSHNVRSSGMIGLVFLSCAWVGMLNGCISVALPNGKATKAQNLIYAEPGRPFVRIQNSSVDRAWQNSTNGNTIGFLSECNSGIDLDLQVMTSEALHAMTRSEIVEQKELLFAERQGLRTVAIGDLDGVAVQMEILILKKNNCSFSLSYVGRRHHFAENRALFEQFLSGFQIP